MIRSTVALAVVALAVSCGSSSTGGTGGGSAGGSGGGSAGGAGGGSAGGAGGGTGGSGGGSAIVQPLSCTPAGFATAPATINPTDFVLGGQLSVESADSDRSAVSGLSNGNSIRLNVTTTIPSTELSVFANGCKVGKRMDFGEEYWWTTVTGDTRPAPVAGNFFVLELVRQGFGVVRRTSLQLPMRLANLDEPLKNAAFTGATTLKWKPMGLATTPGASMVSGFASGITPSGGGFSSMSVNNMLDDASGQATATGQATYKDLGLQWSVRYGALTVYFIFHRPVN